MKTNPNNGRKFGLWLCLVLIIAGWVPVLAAAYFVSRCVA